jgi:hypothetical protein
MLNVVILNVVMLNVVMMCVVMLNVVMLNVVMLRVVAQCQNYCTVLKAAPLCGLQVPYSQHSIFIVTYESAQ